MKRGSVGDSWREKAETHEERKRRRLMERGSVGDSWREEAETPGREVVYVRHKYSRLV